MLFFIIIIQFIGCFSSYFEDPVIIQLEEYTNLICSLKQNNTITPHFDEWIGKYKNGTIISNFNSTKFKKFNINNKKILQIKNITEDDKKSIFKCQYIINEFYGSVFTDLNSSTFINLLYEDNINIKYVVNNMNLKKININFDKIFPIPECFIKIKNESIFPKNSIQNETIDYLYSQVNLSMEIEKTNCHNKIEIICILINQTFTIETKNNTCMYNTKNLPILVIIIVVILSILYIFLLILYICIKIQKLNIMIKEKRRRQRIVL